jgi:hypothetical protein
MNLPECCANCESLPIALKDPNCGRKLKYVYDVDVNDPDNWTGGCQSFWEGIRKHDPKRQFTHMGCRYYSTPRNWEMFVRFESRPEKEKLKMRLQFDKMREKR